MEVSITCNWPFEFLLDPDTEQVAVLLGRYGKPDKLAKVRESHYSPDNPGHSYTVERIMPVPNAHDDPSHHYSIRLRDLRAVLREAAEDQTIVGIAHTHPPEWTGEPSIDDKEGLIEDWIGAVVSGNEQTVRWFAGRGPNLYLGKN